MKGEYDLVSINIIQDFMKIKLQGVMETMLITLVARARDFHSSNPILNDKKSAEMVEQIDYDFSAFPREFKNDMGSLARAKTMDIEIQKFIQAHPDAHIVSIGSGLDTRFHRLDNGKIHWYDLDFPEVIEVRKKFFQESERVKFISKSALDETWTREIDLQGKKLLIISEGVIMYFQPEEIKKLLNLLTDNFEQFELHLDCISKIMVGRAKVNKAVKKTNAQFYFGVKDGSELLELNPKLKQIGCINFTDEMKKHLRGFQRLMTPIIYLFNNRLVKFTYNR